jgi:hypothetical protein
VLLLSALEAHWVHIQKEKVERGQSGRLTKKKSNKEVEWKSHNNVGVNGCRRRWCFCLSCCGGKYCS